LSPTELESLASRIRIEVKRSDTGLYATGWLQPGVDDREISRRAALKGLDLPALSRYYHARRPMPGLLFNYANVPPADIRRGIDLLATIV
jgi:DNA-binding transcriptional MocR family regulator